MSSYFDSDTITHYAFGPVNYYHRTMQQYSEAFDRAGLLLRRLFDVQMTEEMVAGLPA